MWDYLDKLPDEWKLGIIFGAALFVLIAWHFLTRDNPVGPVVPNRSFFGIAMVLCGIAGMAYSQLFFDVSVSTGYGQRVANLDLMQQRQNLLILGGVILIVGVLILLLGRRSSTDNSPVAR